MPQRALLSIFCRDRTGLIAAITARLYDLGVNLGDTTFAVLGGGAELTAVCELPDGQALAAVEADLRGLPALADAKLTLSAFPYHPVHAESAHITHRLELVGDDSPGLLARLSEVFVEFGANIVRLNSEQIPGTGGVRYATRVAVWIPADKAKACLATVANTAGEMRLSCRWEETTR